MGGKRTGCSNISYSDKRRMQELRNEGWLVKEIAAEFGVSPTSVRNHTKPRYVADGYSTREARDRDIVKYRDEKYLSWEEIARRFHITRRTALDSYRRSKKNERTC